MSYHITRKFFNSSKFPDETIKTGLTLEEAQAHCQDPETSSKTATSPEAVQLTQERGKWFDCYNETPKTTWVHGISGEHEVVVRKAGDQFKVSITRALYALRGVRLS